MCGHVGLAGKLEYKDEAALKRLLLFDYFRGTDSTGLAAIRNTNDAHIVKIASHPIDLFDTKTFNSVLTASSSKAFIGHNRAATRGKVNAVNAHPYEYGHIIGAHNGTLTPASWKTLEESLGEPTAVDSMAIFAHIEKFGIDETVPLLQGAWALVWFDLKKNTLNFLRNKERSFYYAWEKGFKKVIWASEWPMIQAATEMAGAVDSYDLWEDKDDCCFFPTDTDVLYTFCIDDMLEGADERPDVRIKELKGKEPELVVTYNNAYNHNYHGDGSPFQGNSGGTNGTTALGTDKTKYPPEITVDVTVKDPLGDFADKGDFQGMTLGGCMYCHDPVEFHDVGLVIFDEMDQVLCSTCSSSSTTRILLSPKTYDAYVSKLV